MIKSRFVYFGDCVGSRGRKHHGVKRSIVSAMVLMLACLAHAQTAELTLDQEMIVPGLKTAPSPEGRVDENPPFLHVFEPYDRGRGHSNVGKRMHYFQLSQDPAFQRGVISSGGRRWSFYNPYRKLEKGVWYWKYATAENGTGTPKWSETFSFKIDGHERLVTPPVAEKLIESIVSTPRPHVMATVDQVGSLISKSPRLEREFEEWCRERKDLKIPETFITPESAVPEKLKSELTKRGKENGIFVYRMKRTRDKYTRYCSSQVNPQIRAYLLSGKEEDKIRAVTAYRAAQDGYREIVNAKMNMDFVHAAYVYSSTLFYDVLGVEMSDVEREELGAELLKDAENLFRVSLDNLEHVNHNSHAWQSDIGMAVPLCIVLSKDYEQAREWLSYFYDLFLFRAPTGSRSDGGWFPGNGYVGANEGTLTAVPFVLGQLTGYDYFQHPWYLNVSKQFALSGPAGMPAGGYGDKADSSRNKLRNLSLMLSFVHEDNEWDQWRVHTLDQQGVINLSLASVLGGQWYLLSAMQRAERDSLKRGEPTPPEQSAAIFRDIGLVASQTNLEDLSENVSVLMRACPFGQTAHSHAAQNAFNITAGGQKLFYKTGYYTSHADAHSLQSYKHTRAQNTILADGCAQDFSPTGYGWMARFVDSDQLTYALGDASNAYNGNYGKYSRLLEKMKVEVSLENGFGDPDVTRFRRHLLFLKPSHILIYDELVAEKPVEWTFRLNAPGEIKEIKPGVLRTENDHYTADAQLYCRDKMGIEITDQFVGEAFDFQGKLGQTENQWHSSISTVNKTKATYFLTVIDISKKSDHEPHTFRTVKSSGLAEITTDKFIVRAQLDPRKESLLVASSKDGKMLFSTGVASEMLPVNGKNKSAKYKGSTLLLENGEFKEWVDEVPDAVRYGNLY